MKRREFLKAVGAGACLAARDADRVNFMKPQLEGWPASVVRSLNGKDYR